VRLRSKEMKEWTAQITEDTKQSYIGILEFQVDDEWHNFEVVDTGDKLLFGGCTNIGFFESGT